MASSSVALETTSLGCTFDGTADMEEIDLPEIDGALLTALLEESQEEEPAQDEHLSYVLRSLEAEIGHPGTTATVGNSSCTSDGEYSMDGDPEESLLDEMLSDTHSCSSSACMLADDPFGYGWAGVDGAVPSFPGHEMSDWYNLSSDYKMAGLMGYEDSQGYPPYSFYCDDVPLEEGYGPLWQ